MNDQRILELEREVSDVRVENAELATNVGHLADSVDKLTVTVDGLRDSMNRGRGALWGISGVVSLLSASAAVAATKLFGGQ